MILNSGEVKEINVENLPIIAYKNTRFVKKQSVEIVFLNIVKETLNSLSNLFRPDQLQINLSNLNNIEVLADDVLMIKLGHANNVSKKHTVLKILLKEIRNRWDEVEYIDIKSIKNPVIKFK